ncbi:MAG TPA: exo-alpha-sialidase [Candidatus Hydrogenedentes bacterium]|nr:exo-alpha-sialidase [Candidatus Hydrogenedentota bacterium]
MPRWFLPIAAIALAMHFSALAVEEKGDDPALAAPPIIMNPGPEYADSTRLFQGIPGIERAPNGRLWATWYAGGDNEGPLNYCALATSGDDGKTWSSVQIAIDPPGDVRAFDPCLWHDPSGRLWWFWAQGFSLWDGRAGVWAIATDNSGDASPVWSEPRRLCDGIMMNKPTVTRSGEWLLPVAIWEFPARVMKEEYAHDITAGTGSNVWISRDQGATFELLGRPDVEGRACDEHMIIERNDGSLWVLVRTRTGLGEAISTDGGRTWTEHIVAETVTQINRSLDIDDFAGAEPLVAAFRSMLSAVGLTVNDEVAAVADEAADLCRQRDDARAAKEWGRADALRGELEAMGYVVEDTATGTQVRRA